nr:hypothetical protein [uncultured Rikenella sp.]
MKYFYKDVPECHIAVAGSLLGISRHKDVSYLVGKVNEIGVYPMSLGEFLIIKGEEGMYNLLINRDFNVINPLHEKYVELLLLCRRYARGGRRVCPDQCIAGGAAPAERYIDRLRP